MSNQEKKLTKALLSLGTSPKLKGFRYLKAGIRYCISDPRSVTNLSKKLYPMLAEKFDTTPQAVERAARAAIQNGWYRRDCKLADEIFGSTLQSSCDTPSNSLYIAAVTEWMREDDEDELKIK